MKNMDGCISWPYLGYDNSMDWQPHTKFEAKIIWFHDDHETFTLLYHHLIIMMFIINGEIRDGFLEILIEIPH